MTGSGFENIVIEAWICATWSINQMLLGKHYNSAMRVHKLMYDSLERLLIQSLFASKEEMQLFIIDLQDKLKTFILSPSVEELDS